MIAGVPKIGDQQEIRAQKVRMQSRLNESDQIRAGLCMEAL